MFCIVLLALACDKKPVEEPVVAEPVTLPVELSYKGATKIGDMENVKTVLSCNKRFSELNADLAEFFADSVDCHFADGTEIVASRDSVVSVIAGFIGTLSSLKIDFIAAVPVDNIDLKHEWVFAWTDEVHTFKDGTVVEQSFHEDYRMQGGKIREIFQYVRKLPVESK